MGGAPGSGALRPNSQSAFLGPLLWERTLPCDGGLFQLQYMDLEEFLTENGMGMHSNGASSTSAQIPSQVRLVESKTHSVTNFTWLLMQMLLVGNSYMTRIRKDQLEFVHHLKTKNHCLHLARLKM